MRASRGVLESRAGSFSSTRSTAKRPGRVSTLVDEPSFSRAIDPSDASLLSATGVDDIRSALRIYGIPEADIEAALQNGNIS